MSAAEDFCGCGEATCPECFGGAHPDELPVTGNAWLDEAFERDHPGILARHRAVGTITPTHCCPLCSTILDPADSNADWFQRCRTCGEVVHPEATEG